jgi:hypothetical protein
VLTIDDSATGPYKPRSGKIGASFRHFSPSQFKYILDAAKPVLRQFGYDTETQNFPAIIRLPHRQIKHGIAGSSLTLSADGLDIRNKRDTFGRLSTYFRKMLLEPVIASDGSELNMHEVEAAREWQKRRNQENEDSPQHALPLALKMTQLALCPSGIEKI